MLAISANAVKKHISRLLGVSNRTELAALAGRWGAGPPERLNPAIHVIAVDRTEPRAAAA